MKPLPIFISCVLAMQTLANDAKTNAVPESTTGASPIAAEKQTTAITVPFSSAMITAPFVLTNGIISQPDQTELDGGGKAVWKFTIAADGDYVIRAVVNAADESANSFFLNIDTQPQDPEMI